LKILSIGPANPLRGGIARFNESFAIACKSAGHEVEIVSFRFLYPGFLFPGKSQYTDDPPPDDISIHTWLHSVNPINWLVCSGKIKRLKPDLIVFHYWMPFFAPVMGFLARRIKKSTGANVMAIAHNLIPHEKQIFSGTFTRYFVNSLDGLVCLSTSVLNDLRKINKVVPATFLPHPVYDVYGNKLPREQALDHLMLDKKKKYLLFFGLIRKYKGLELLLRSFALVDIPDLELIVAGEFYGQRDFYFNLTDELGISKRVIYTDSFVPDEKVKYYFSAADLVVQPYITATQSGVTQIAYQFDCPMLVTDTGGLAEIVSHSRTGFVCKKDPAVISETIEQFFKQNMADEMIGYIRTEKHKFSWKGFIEEFMKMRNAL